MEEDLIDKELIDSIKSNITEQGFRISGNGIICENTRKMLEKLDKIQKFLYYLEKRQDEMFEFMKNKGMQSR